MFLDDLSLDWMSRAPLLLRANDVTEVGPPRLAHLLASEYIRLKYLLTWPPAFLQLGLEPSHVVAHERG